MMGRRGPRPKPTAVIRASSCTWRGKRNRNEPKPPPGNPPCPKWLEPEAKKTWRKVLKHLQIIKLLTPIDGNILARYCQTWVRYKRMILFLRQYGETYRITRPNGSLACLLPFPETVLASRLSVELLRMEQEMGFTPSARSRIMVVPDPAVKSSSDPVRDERLRRLFEGGGPAKPRRPRRNQPQADATDEDAGEAATA